jgi:hypothetical protein
MMGEKPKEVMMSAEDLAQAAVAKLSAELGDEQFATILDRAVEKIMLAAATGRCDLEMSARIKEIVAEVRDEVEAEQIAKQRNARPRRLHPEARRP